MIKALPKAYHNRVVSAEKLAVRWIETPYRFGDDSFQSISRKSPTILLQRHFLQRLLHQAEQPQKSWFGGFEKKCKSWG